MGKLKVSRNFGSVEAVSLAVFAFTEGKAGRSFPQSVRFGSFNRNAPQSDANDRKLSSSDTNRGSLTMKQLLRVIVL